MGSVWGPEKGRAGPPGVSRCQGVLHGARWDLKVKDDYWAAINWQSQGAEARGSLEAGSGGHRTGPNLPRGRGAAPTCPKARGTTV